MVNVEAYDARISSRLLRILGMSMITLEDVPRSVSCFSGTTVARMPDYYNSCSFMFPFMASLDFLPGMFNMSDRRRTSCLTVPDSTYNNNCYLPWYID